MNRRVFFPAVLGSGLALGQATTKIKTNQQANPGGSSLVEKSMVVLTAPANGQITLPDSPAPGTIVWVMRNGLVQAEGVDYTISGKIVAFAFPTLLATDDIVIVRYRA